MIRYDLEADTGALAFGRLRDRQSVLRLSPPFPLSGTKARSRALVLGSSSAAKQNGKGPDGIAPSGIVGNEGAGETHVRQRTANRRGRLLRLTGHRFGRVSPHHPQDVHSKASPPEVATNLRWGCLHFGQGSARSMISGGFTSFLRPIRVIRKPRVT